MYKQTKNNRSRSVKRESPIRWAKRKIILFFSALMIGMSNAIYDEDKVINGGQDKIEQRENND